MDNIYILKLKEGKYYIGKTNNIEKRWNEHILQELVLVLQKNTSQSL